MKRRLMLKHCGAAGAYALMAAPANSRSIVATGRNKAPAKGEVIVLAPLIARPGKESTMRDVLIKLSHEVRKEPGCIKFQVFETQRTLGHFYMYEIYADEAAFEAHLKQRYVVAFIASLPAVSDSSQKDLILLKDLDSPE